MKKKSNYTGVIILSVVAAVCVLAAAAAVFVLVREVGKDEEVSKRITKTERAGKSEEEDLTTEMKPAEEAETEAETDKSEEMAKEDLQPVLDAYQVYIDEHLYDGEEYYGCALLYLNDDKIPECYYAGLTMGAVFLSYKDGEVFAAESQSSGALGCYQEKNNRVRFSALSGSRGYEEFYELSDDGTEFTRVGYAAADHIETGVYYIGVDERIGTLLDYQKYLALMGPFLSLDFLDTVDEAYEALKLPAMHDGTSEYEFTQDLNDISGEDYALCLNPDDYTGSGSEVTDFSYFYPGQLFEYAVHNSEPIENKYGTNISTSAYYGPQGSQFRFSISLRTDPGSIKEATDFIYEGEMSSLQEPSEIKHVTEQDYGRVIVTGYNTPRDKLVYDLVKVDKDYVMQMMIAFPVYTSEEDELQKGYVTECMYRMCGFSGSSQPPRSYEEYREAVR